MDLQCQRSVHITVSTYHEGDLHKNHPRTNLSLEDNRTTRLTCHWCVQVGGNAFATAKDCVDEVCIVNEDSIALAILRLVEIEKNVIEGAGASGLAACLSGKLDRLLKGKK